MVAGRLRHGPISIPSLPGRPPTVRRDQHFPWLQIVRSGTYAKIYGVVAGDLCKKYDIKGSHLDSDSGLTSRETVLKRIIDTITHRNTTMTSELIRLNQWMRCKDGISVQEGMVNTATRGLQDRRCGGSCPIVSPKACQIPKTMSVKKQPQNTCLARTLHVTRYE